MALFIGRDSEFLGKLKNAWDLYFSQNPQLILALSGSMSVWIKYTCNGAKNSRRNC